MQKEPGAPPVVPTLALTQTFMEALRRVPEALVVALLQNAQHEVQAPFCARYLLACPRAGYRKAALCERIQCDDVPAREVQYVLHHLSEALRGGCAPVAVREILPSGQLQPHVLLYVPRRYDGTGACEGLCAVQEGVFRRHLARALGEESAASGAAAGLYCRLLTRLFAQEDPEDDVDQRPLRLGRLEWAERSALPAAQTPGGAERAQLLFARYTPTQLSADLSWYAPALAPDTWAVQRSGFDEAFWLPLWGELKRVTERCNGPLLAPRLRFPVVVLRGMQAVHDRARGGAVDARFGSWSNLTHIRDLAPAECS